MKYNPHDYQKYATEYIETNPVAAVLLDMGLGKTLQVISLLLSEQQEYEAGEKEKRRSIIICPASLVYNWKKEIERFAPSIETVMITGSAPTGSSTPPIPTPPLK